MQTERITDRQRIKQVLRDFMLKPGEQKVPFVLEIRVGKGADWNGRTVPAGGLIIDGARPSGGSYEPGSEDYKFSLTNSDSGYRASIGAVNLLSIESIQVAV